MATLSSNYVWKPSSAILADIDLQVDEYRHDVIAQTAPLIARYASSIGLDNSPEYRKLVELTTKMTVVGRSCCEVAGEPFTVNRRTLSILYGMCCFLADSFIDDYGEAAALNYLDRFERLLSHGWFEPVNDRETLFYIVLGRAFAIVNILDPMLRQAIYALFEAQRRDVLLRSNSATFRALGSEKQLTMLRNCARDRSGHAITVLARMLVPSMPLALSHPLFLAGALIMYIDDHGDCWADKKNGRGTFMNRVHNPVLVLGTLYRDTITAMRRLLPKGNGRDLLCGFLYRYYVTRLAKHDKERAAGGLSWAVYE